ncbi:MAG: TlpA family protein disulfide reductase [Gallionellaceae bacterium]|nr:TlpA family protein disulfide reductase [Gallionellaceae bacterium]
MKPFSLIFSLMLCVFITACKDAPKEAQTGEPSRETPVTQASAEPAPVYQQLGEATLYKLAGGTEMLSQYRGKPLIINVWASWCGPCRAEMASLDRLASRYHGKQFNVIGVSTDDDTQAAADYVKQSKLSFPNYLDSRDFYIEGMLGASNIPLTVLVSADGRILEKVNGAREWDEPDIVRAIGEIFQVKLQN